jgi:hypothetical protein
MGSCDFSFCNCVLCIAKPNAVCYEFYKTREDTYVVHIAYIFSRLITYIHMYIYTYMEREREREREAGRESNLCSDLVSI